IPVGGSRTFGYCASSNGTVEAPTNGMINDSPVAITFLHPNASGLVAPAATLSQPAELTIYPTLTSEETTIGYTLTTGGPVSLLLYDPSGRLLRTLVAEPQAAGRHSLQLTTRQLAGGIHFVRLVSGELQLTRRLVVVR
ncbi:MAG: T9SS type A sorting domain-containing protein, partial [Bacteroidota bacterium]